MRISEFTPWNVFPNQGTQRSRHHPLPEVNNPLRMLSCLKEGDKTVPCMRMAAWDSVGLIPDSVLAFSSFSLALFSSQKDGEQPLPVL